ncbi:DMT family transporter [Streptacidiphilus jiangxiensis]|uniref:Permease of the drug/metabolite transporter (DMT) superfamily n=1 Tax=Streptacidiphilus jiangxiensis TaxID=235985 RepID=A0A1H7YX40_STRJI|nr:EamA family transporter [Streptacidiphilus jiangxiensis]SEM50842.1 Permease of the drug/metabolite transporter (DMT) superfamily [Streptacidiphilus jiangxiensis]
MDRNSPRLAQLLPGMAGMALVGGSVTVSRTLVDAPLFTSQAVRYAAATATLLLLARFAGARVVRPRGREWLWLAGLAVSGLVLFNVAVVRGVAHAEPAAVAVAVACVPLVLGLVGPLLERRRPSRQVLLAAPVVMLGAVLVEGTGRTDAVGLGWAALALCCEAAFTLLAVPVLPRHSPWGVSVHATWMGAAVFATLGVTREGPSAVTKLTMTQWAATGYLALMVTAVAFVLWYSTVRAVGAGRAGLLTGIAPLSAALVATASGTGAPGATVWLGIAVVIAGLVLGLRQRAAERAGVEPVGEPVREPVGRR